jgi:hypothetical protein
MIAQSCLQFTKVESYKKVQGMMKDFEKEIKCEGLPSSPEFKSPVKQMLKKRSQRLTSERRVPRIKLNFNPP